MVGFHYRNDTKTHWNVLYDFFIYWQQIYYRSKSIYRVNLNKQGTKLREIQLKILWFLCQVRQLCLVPQVWRHREGSLSVSFTRADACFFSPALTSKRTHFVANTRWFKYDRDWFVCKQAALRSSCANLRQWSHNLHPPSCSG